MVTMMIVMFDSCGDSDDGDDDNGGDNVDGDYEGVMIKMVKI